MTNGRRGEEKEIRRLNVLENPGTRNQVGEAEERALGRCTPQRTRSKITSAPSHLWSSHSSAFKQEVKSTSPTTQSKPSEGRAIHG